MRKTLAKYEQLLKKRIEDDELVASDIWEVPGLKFLKKTWAIQPERYYAIPHKGPYGLGYITYPGDEPEDELTEKDYWVVTKETPSWLVHAISHAVKHNNKKLLALNAHRKNVLKRADEDD